MKSMLLLLLSLFALGGTPTTALAEMHPDSDKICGKKSCSSVRKKLKYLSYRGSFQANKVLGIIYFDGIGVEKNLVMARRYFIRSASGGDADSALILAELYKGPYKNDREESQYWLDVAEKLYKKSSKEVRRASPLNFTYDYSRSTLSDINEKLIAVTPYARAYGVGSHILGKGCGLSSMNRCTIKSSLGVHRRIISFH